MAHPCKLVYLIIYRVPHDAIMPDPRSSDRHLPFVSGSNHRNAESEHSTGPDRNKLALPGSFEKQFSRSSILDRLSVNRMRSESGRPLDLKLKGLAN
jgi:hypothetical protein